MVNRYRKTELPSWVHGASNERLIEHIQYLTHNAIVDRKVIANARYRYRKAEKQLDDVEKKTMTKILAHIEKNCTEVEEVEEYLWQQIDKGTEFE